MKDLSESTILIVDDTETNIDVLIATLGKDYRFKVAKDGRRALKIISEDPPDLILLDIMMPVMNGYQVLEQLKQNPKLRQLPVIMISAIDEMESVIKCIEMGAEDYLSKPFDAVLLKARIGAALEKKMLRDKERLYARRLERDLEIGREIQSSFLPTSLPQMDGWEIAAHFKAARKVSGDFYDAFPLADGSGLSIVVTDVCGKGVGAALFTGIFRTLIRALSDLYYRPGSKGSLGKKRERGPQTRGAPKQSDNDHTDTLEATILHINNYVALTHGETDMFATLFWGIIDASYGTLSYLNCGHEEVIVAGPKGIKRILEPTGPAVGMLPEMGFKAECIDIDPGDVVVILTDGITEARNADGQLYGSENLKKALGMGDLSARQLLDRITTSLAAHTEGAEQSDDITLMVIHRR